MAQRIGRYTIGLGNTAVKGYASVVGKKEGEGPLAAGFDYISEDTAFGEKTWEKAESRLQKDVLSRALNKAGATPDSIDIIFSGDLLNQCIGSSYGLREFNIPFIGLYGACSTMAEALTLSAVFVDTGCAGMAAALTSSHFCAAERQFRFPLEYGGQRPPSAQWTVTGGGAVIVSRDGTGPLIKEVTIGRIADLGVKDINNMGAAMAPAAAETLKDYFADTGRKPDDFDLITTGDLGSDGSELLRELMERENIKLGTNYTDCGLMIYDREKQDVHAGGSGCGCSGSVLCSFILNNMCQGKLGEVLFLSTGALMSPMSVQQGESIPSVAHLVHLSSGRK
ncbi:MAG: stage V sporulation protein AD [Clostridia bacterium]|nr:stage V sporulation protein AD [Clostridia bacterium]MDR3644544.1 stage V sporulation protein AD [Clostridia bacterium]